MITCRTSANLFLPSVKKLPITISGSFHKSAAVFCFECVWHWQCFEAAHWPISLRSFQIHPSKCGTTQDVVTRQQLVTSVTWVTGENGQIFQKFLSSIGIPGRLTMLRQLPLRNGKKLKAWGCGSWLFKVDLDDLFSTVVPPGRAAIGSNGCGLILGRLLFAKSVLHDLDAVLLAWSTASGLGNVYVQLHGEALAGLAKI